MVFIIESGWLCPITHFSDFQLASVGIFFIKVVLSQILLKFILEDSVFQWGHRILQTKWLYKYATPFGLTSEYAHLAEILFLGFATIVGPAITHLITF